MFIIAGLIVALLTTMTLHHFGVIRYPWEDQKIISGKPGSLQGGKQSDGEGVTLIINSEPVFDNGSSMGSLFIENPQKNGHDMKVQIYLGSDNKGELLYQTNYIPPGYYIDYDYLLVDLEKGTHDAIAYFTFYKDGVQSTTPTVNLKLIINN